MHFLVLIRLKGLGMCQHRLQFLFDFGRKNVEVLRRSEFILGLSGCLGSRGMIPTPRVINVPRVLTCGLADVGGFEDCNCLGGCLNVLLDLVGPGCT